jgi:hypothetical protein
VKVMLSAVTILTLAVASAFAKDHAAEYQAGTFSATGQLSDGSIAQCNHGNCNSRGAAHNVHYVRTDDGMYVIEAPISVGASILEAYATAGIGPTLHKEWFMDQLHEGDKVLFRAECNKHNDCQFWLPNPDREGKEYRTLGIFRPDHAQTNTSALCRSGKLRPEVAAQVCPAMPAPAVSAPAPVPAAAPAAPASAAVPATTTPAPVASAAPTPAAASTAPGYLPPPTGPRPAYLPDPATPKQ